MGGQQSELGLVINRIKRAHGQLAGVLRMVEEGRDLEEVVTQLKAVARALDRAGFALLSAELRGHVGGSDLPEEVLARLERLFLSLA